MSNTGDYIRQEIKELLKSAGKQNTRKNIELIFREHMGDSQDRPLSFLVRQNSYLLD